MRNEGMHEGCPWSRRDRKMFRDRDHAAILQPPDERCAQRGHYVLMAAEGTVVDDVGIVGVRVDVHDRRKVHVDSESAKLRTCDLPGLVRIFCIPRLANGQRTRQRGDAGFDSCYRAVLLIRCDQEGNPDRSISFQARNSTLQFVRRFRHRARYHFVVRRLGRAVVVRPHASNIVLVQNHAADPEIRQQRLQSLVSLEALPVEANHEELADLLPDGHRREDVFDTLLVRSRSQRLP